MCTLEYAAVWGLIMYDVLNVPVELSSLVGHIKASDCCTKIDDDTWAYSDHLDALGNAKFCTSMQ